MDNDEEGPAIKCRTAMLELSLTHDGMADFLGLDRSVVIRMCLNDEQLPPKHQHKVAILINLHRDYTSVARLPVMQLAKDFLMSLYQRGGCLWLNDAITLSGLSGPQLKNIENIEHWLAIVWETMPGKYGVHPYVYLTARGHRAIGKVLAPGAHVPSRSARPVVIKGLDEVQQALRISFNRQIEWHLKIADSIRQIEIMMTLGMTSVDQALELYDAAVGQLPTPTSIKTITRNNQDEN